MSLIDSNFANTEIGDKKLKNEENLPKEGSFELKTNDSTNKEITNENRINWNKKEDNSILISPTKENQYVNDLVIILLAKSQCFCIRLNQ